MAFLVPLMGGLFTTTAGTATAAGVGAAAAGTAATAGGLSLGGILTSALSAAATGASIYGSLQSNKAQGQMYGNMANDAALQAQQAKIQGESNALDVRQRLLDTLQGQRVAYLANGIDISSGTPQSARASAEDEANRQVDIARRGANMSALQAESQASQYKRQMRYSRGAALYDAIGTLGSYGVRKLNQYGF